MAITTSTKRAKEIAKKAKKPVKAGKKPVAKSAVSAKSEKSTSKNPLARLVKYFKDSRQELKKVTWPSNKEALRLTITVLLFTFLITGVAVVADFIVSNILERYLV